MSPCVAKKTKPKIRFENTSSGSYTCNEWPVVKNRNIKTEPTIYVLFVFEG